MVIDRYLIREIVKPFIVIWAVLAILITSYGAAEFLSNAVNGLLPLGMLVQLVGLRTLIAFDVLIPISLYLSVVLALGRMHADSELTSLSALGVGPVRVAGIVTILSVCIALGVGGLSLILRPWAYQRSHELADLAGASLNTGDMRAGTFYVDRQASRTIFIGQRAGPEAPGLNVFVQLKLPGATRIIAARTVKELPGARAGGGAVIHLTDAHVYDIRDGGIGRDLVMNVKNLVLTLPTPHVRPPEYSSVAASTVHLAPSRSPADISELEWRLSTPVSTVLLGMLGVLLSRSRPREHKHARLGIAILVYAGYYLWYESVRTWAERGVISTRPGVWWAPAALAAVLLAAFLAPKLRSLWRSARYASQP
ncbi:MAG: LPS export ABC transporter permease LptF [Steroidobacteraceae bacterium]